MAAICCLRAIGSPTASTTPRDLLCFSTCLSVHLLVYAWYLNLPSGAHGLAWQVALESHHIECAAFLLIFNALQMTPTRPRLLGILTSVS